jgi:hypothetical protein
MARITTFVTVAVLNVLLAGYALADPTPTPQPGPSLTPQQNVSISADVRQRVVLGAIVVVLFAIVWYGRRVRRKRQQSS